MKTTLGVALTPPSAAALIAGACLLAATFMPSCHARGPSPNEPTQITETIRPQQAQPVEPVATTALAPASARKPTASTAGKAAAPCESGNATRAQR